MLKQVTEFQLEELKWNLETYCGIIKESLDITEKELDEFLHIDIDVLDSNKLDEHEEEFKKILNKKSRHISRLRGFCKAMEIVEEELGIELEIPHRTFKK